MDKERKATAEIEELRRYEPTAITRFDFSKSETHHGKPVRGYEIVILYIDGA